MKNIDEKKIVYQGDLFQLVTTVVYSEKQRKIRFFEKAHRPPGVRMLFLKENTMLLTREFRPELNTWDYRLPGGKVFDEFLTYQKYLGGPDGLLEKIKQAVVLESKQEAGINVSIDDTNLICKSIAGASVIWDLYYFEIKVFEEVKDGQELEEGEKIELPVWVSFDDVLKMCLSGQINEDRTVAVLLKYILNNKLAEVSNKSPSGLV